MMKLSPHLSDFEMRCGQLDGCEFCGGKLPDVPKRLLDGFELLRELVKQPIHVTSGYRCPERLGDSKSQHCKCNAMDIFVAGMDCITLMEYAEKVSQFQQGGIGIYPSKGGNGSHDFIHVDIGPKRRWGRWNGVYRDISQVMAML